ncbi:MAG: site-2 protease family protein [Syntrophorhabdaceae bacterium]|nr:site-2 protease family protein [Syntrophorhabdaceae bacterium]MDD4196141.1 site-2 protease family protein [Syntrophorhabdaceae bacterium]
MIFLHILLFLVTIISTVFVGGYLYSCAIMTILLCHEMGHYIMTRRHGIPSTLPFFIPLPLPPFGTFGALIKMKGVVTDRKALFDIGIAGPLSGFIVAIPFIIAGIKLSTITKISGVPPASYMELGEPLLFKMLEPLLVGEIPKGYELLLHPLAYAGWVGLFVTSLNLLPVGQLDGGHIVYAVFGRQSKWVFYGVIFALSILAILHNVGWLTLVILLMIFGRNHPRPFDAETALDGRRKKLAVLMLVVFILSFIPAPFPEVTIKNLLQQAGWSR